MNRKTLVLPAIAGLLAPLLVACGNDSAGGKNGGTIVVGTTDRIEATAEAPAPLDPAAVYDVSTWNVFRNTFQTLLRLPRAGTQPEAEAAEECGFTDQRSAQYRCTLREGLTFSNGHDLTAEDVVFSVNRMLDINDPGGPASLLSNLDRVEAPSGNEVVFHLRKPDATFPYKLATPAAAIVDSEVYPADKVHEGYGLVGSGPYVLESFDAGGGRAVLARNDAYKGDLELRNGRVELRFFDDSQAMEKALRDGDIDVMNRSLSPEQIDRLGSDKGDGIDVVEMSGQEIRYLVFATDDPVAGRKAVRQAIAQTVDRGELVRDVYARTAEPLYSIVPSGLTGHHNSFFNVYGEPDVKAARAVLERAGVETPVSLELTYTTDHYGPATAEEFEVLAKQLNGSGLFRATVKGVPWKTYRPASAKQQYAVYGMGWFPDFPDPDNFVAPFFAEDNFLGSPYENNEIREQLIPRTRVKEQRDTAVEDFVRVQDIVAKEVPVLPLWQGKQYVAARDGVTGVEWALNSSSVLQLWELGRSVQG
ncbi:ABC transporter substrate-binding protein [Streptomyces sp. DH37]|uniref:ABC transporter substrate-binding protein n=1 Tax=Streptomyces sp. DH37 TaxID=3040122 RepID=UPI0024432299|nr:ABC transporter substrate-binding protein [Streptomyces sp. DH37]MDG9705643.1 ABC transporter substrate-binding protein [Streptomyces sp. DH37]